MKTVICILAAAAALSACAGEYNPSYQINQIVILNNSRETVRDVSIELLAGNHKFGCDEIAPLEMCDLRFTRRHVSDQPVLVEWTLGEERNVETVPAHVSINYVTGLVLTGVLEINPDDTIVVRFEQQSSYQ